MKRVSLSMAVILPLLLLTMPALVFNTPSRDRAAEVEQLQPLKAAQLATLPDGSRVMLEGEIDKSSATKFQSFVYDHHPAAAISITRCSLTRRYLSRRTCAEKYVV